MSVLWLLVLTAAFMLIQAVLFRVNNLKKLSYDRSFSRKTAFEGEKVELLESLRNEKRLPVPWLRAESRIPKEIGFEKESLAESHEVIGGMYHKSVFYIPAMNAITRHHQVTLKRRGVYYAGSVVLTAGDLFGFARDEKQLNTDCEITVYPALIDENELPDPANRWLGDAVVRRWIMPDPFLVNGIRDYMPGDPLKDVHWKASARTGDLRVKVRDYTTDPKALVILNVATSENQWADVGAQDVESVEYGIRMAATLCVRALKNGLNAGFASNACLIGQEGSGETVYVPSAGGNAQADRLLETMARMLLHMELSFTTFLESLTDVSGEDILIISAYESEEIKRAVHMLTSLGNTVSFIRLERGRRTA